MSSTPSDTSILSGNFSDQTPPITKEQEKAIIDQTNELLSSVGIIKKDIHSFSQLARVAPSMFVAIYEILYQVRLEDIIRTPTTHEDYVTNSKIVIDSLSSHLSIDLSHIQPKKIASGDFLSLSNLLNIFTTIVKMAKNYDENYGYNDDSSISVSFTFHVLLLYFYT